jgi:tRNA threonylcarbamoyladenosine biosynthesis protein TsaB
MYAVGLDTTTKTLCVGCIQDDTVLGRIIVTGKGYQSENFLLYLEELLNERGVQLKDIDCFSLSIGPGSLTGIRVGLSFLKGIGYPLNIPIVPVETLRALSYEFKEGRKYVCPMLLTRNEKVFCALYQYGEKNTVTVKEQSCSSVDTFLDEIPEDEIYFVGSGALYFRNVIEKRIGERAIFGEPVVFPDPALIASLGLEMVKHQTVPSIDELEPLYLS